MKHKERQTSLLIDTPLGGYNSDDTPAVKVWRDTMKLNTSAGYKSDIELTVGPDGEEGLKLWKSILEGWWYWKVRPDGTRMKVARNKFNVKAQLSAYEELIRKD